MFNGLNKVRQQDVDELKDKVREVLCRLGIFDVIFTGSAGKKSPDQLSGDIDCAFKVDDVDTFDFAAMREALEDMGFETKYIKGLNLIAIPMPYSGGLAQIDLVPVFDLDMAEWGLYSAHYTLTKYKSAVRNLLVMSTLSIGTREVTDEDEDGTPLEWDVYTLQPSVGLFKNHRSIRGTKVKRLKTPKNISRKLVSRDPDVVVDVAFGTGTAEDCLSAEDAMTLLEQSKYSREVKDMIICRARERCIEFGFVYPPEWDSVADDYVEEDFEEECREDFDECAALSL